MIPAALIVEVRKLVGMNPPGSDHPGEVLIHCSSAPESDQTRDPAPASALPSETSPVESGSWRRVVELEEWLAKRATSAQAGGEAVWTEVPIICKGPEGDRSIFISARQDWAAQRVLEDVLRFAIEISDPEQLWVFVE
jgi:hypothetical protein